MSMLKKWHIFHITLLLGWQAALVVGSSTLSFGRPYRLKAWKTAISSKMVH